MEGEVKQNQNFGFAYDHFVVAIANIICDRLRPPAKQKIPFAVIIPQKISNYII